MEYILSIISGGASGAIVIWLMKNWFAERIKQSIKAEYDEKIERLKTSLSFREKTLDTLIKKRNELSGPVDLSSAFEALKTKDQKAIIEYIGEKKDEYSIHYNAFKQVRHLLDDESKKTIDTALSKADIDDGKVFGQLLDGQNSAIMPELINSFLASSSEFRETFISCLEARIEYLSNELIG